MIDDERFRRDFAALRAADRSTAPGFEAVLRRGPRPTRIRRGRAAILAVAACGLALLVFGVTRPEPSPPVTLAAISQWHPETDILLNPPLVGLDALTRPVGSLIDALPPVPPDGDLLR